jgi:hypothetical protein
MQGRINSFEGDFYDPNEVIPNVSVLVKAVVFCVTVSDHFIKYFVRGTLYKDAL